MSESLQSLDTVSTLSDTSTPPIPFGCMIPMSTFLEATNSGIMVETNQRATTTIPTPPRLRTMLKENLCIERWSNTIRTTCEAPGHTPWGNIGDCEEVDWIPEGSVHPYAFQEALAKARTRREACSAHDAKVKVITEPQDSAKRRRRQTTCDSTHRKALVFEREITLDTGGEIKRWSLQVPAVDMSPDMVDVMLELRRLNSFFKEESDEPMMTPPALMISNSHSAMALSLPSTASLHNSPAPKTLAIRRGNLPLPPLLTKSEVPGILELDPYPGIPSAFLGASYSATVSQSHDCQSPHTISKPSGGFKDMINTLRSQCATLQIRQSPHATNFDARKQGLLANGSHATDEEDEWSFARPLLEKYGDQPYLRDPPLNSKVTPPSGAAATVTTFCTAGFADIGTDTAQNSDKYSCPGSLVHDSLTTITPPFKKATGGHSTSRPTQQSPDGTTGSRSIEIIDTSALALSSISPSSDRSPSPRSSSPCNQVTPSPRGILKRCKSVRFAESPIEDDGSVREADRFPQPARLRHSLGSSLQQSPQSKRPAPLRSTDSPNNNRTSRRSTPSSTPTATDSLLTPSLRAAGRQKSPSTYGKVITKPPASSEKPSRNSTAVPTTSLASPPRFTATTPTRRLTRGERAKSQVSATGPPVVFPTPKPKSTTSACSSPTRSRIEAARQTIDASSVRPRASTGALRAAKKDDKENHATKLKARASLSALTYRGRYTMDEGVLRRGILGGNAEAQGSGGGAGPGPTSRMPVPLRKILTRFK
ncbi:hypothetical protein PQX77_017600 [Marasmius sp. AFHP31]|nr:hypothetical protein PQX77_017600 [Marasmius sp. AFHP31]